MIDDAGNLLLVEPRDHFDGYVWTFPKGQPKKDESAEACAAREVMERTGAISQVVTEIPGRFAGTDMPAPAGIRRVALLGECGLPFAR